MSGNEKYAYCSKCERAIRYLVMENGETTFPRGEFIAHNDWIVTGFSTKEEAESAMLAARSPRDEKGA